MEKLFKSPSLLFKLAILLTLIIIYGRYASHLKQDINWDLLDYHFYNGFAALNGRMAWDVSPALVQSYLNPILDVINYLMLSSFRAKTSIFMLGAISGLAAFILFYISLLLLVDLSPVKRFLYSIFAVLIGGTGVAGLGVVGMATNDNYIALLTMLSLMLSLKALLNRPHIQLNYLAASGIVMGFAVACKLVVTAYAIGTSIALLAFLLKEKKQLKPFFVFGISLFISFLIFDGWWMVKVYQQFQNPLFPYYNNLFESPLAQINNYKDPRFYPHSFFKVPFLLAFKGTNIISDEVIRDARLLTLVILTILVSAHHIFFKTKINKPHSISVSSSQVQKNIWVYLIVWYVASYVTWFYLFTIYRYTIALELMSGLFIVILLRKLIRFDYAVYAVILMLFTLYSQTTNYPNWGRMKARKAYFSVTNIPSLPKQSVVMFFSEPLGFVIPFFPRDVRFIGTAFTVPIPPFTEKTKMIDRVNSILKTNKDRVFVLYAKNHERRINLYSNYYNLKVEFDHCSNITTNVPMSRLLLCPANLKG